MPRPHQQSLPEFKHSCLTSVTKLSDRDAGHQAVQELSSLIDNLDEERLGAYVVCLCSGDSDPTENRFARREIIRLFAELADVHQEALRTHLPKVVGSVVRRLRSDDTQVQNAAADTFAMLAARSIPTSGNGNSTLSVLLKPLTQALSEQTPCVQRGAARCVAAVCRGAKPALVLQDADRFVPRLIKHLNRPTCLSRGELLEACGAVVDVISDAIGPHLESLLGSILECLTSTEWPTRQTAVLALEIIALRVNSSMFVAEVPLIIDSLEDMRFDKVRKVREAVAHCIQLYRNLPESSGTPRMAAMPVEPRARTAVPVPTPTPKPITPLEAAHETPAHITAHTPAHITAHTPSVTPINETPAVTPINETPAVTPATQSRTIDVQHQLSLLSDQQMSILAKLQEFATKIEVGMETLDKRITAVEKTMTRSSPRRSVVPENGTAVRIQAKLDSWEANVRGDNSVLASSSTFREAPASASRPLTSASRPVTSTSPVTLKVDESLASEYQHVLDTNDDAQFIALMMRTGPCLDRLSPSVLGRVLVRVVELLGRDPNHADLSFEWINHAIKIGIPIPSDLVKWLGSILCDYAADPAGRWSIRAARLYSLIRKYM